MSNSEADVWSFLDEPVPGSSTQGETKIWWDKWNVRCKSLPAVAPKIFVEALLNSPFKVHYAAILGLRNHGYEAWAQGAGRATTYRIRKGSDTGWQIITPKHPPED